MKPTPKLRFVERNVPSYRGIKILLQQWWEEVDIDGNPIPASYKPKGEWRDVPIERETT